jgi:hypothetical protein
MNSHKTKRPFIPRDRPKSFIIGIIAGLTALLIGGPLLVGGKLLEVGVLLYLGYIIFIACWAVAAIMWVVFGSGLITGRYKNIKAGDWKDQVW